MSTESGMVLVPLEPTEEMLRVAEERNPPFGAPEALTEEYCAKWRARHRRAASELYKAMLAAAPASPPTPAPINLSADDVQWIVNDNAELGVKIGEQFFFCYKGHSLVYQSELHDNGSQMYWRPVFKREFGECVHPVNWKEIREFGHEKTIGTVSLDDSDEWQPLPEPPK